MKKAVKLTRVLGFCFISLILTGCLSPRTYIDPTLPNVAADAVQKPATPQPVQLTFEFQTNGAKKASVSNNYRNNIVETIKKTGVFSDITGTPAADGAILGVVINNIADMKEAQSQGFKAGLTFGAAGSFITDQYVCTMTYMKPGSEPKTAVVKHALHTTIGNHEGPPGLKPEESIGAAVNKAFDQMVLNGMKQLADDGAFKP